MFSVKLLHIIIFSLLAVILFLTMPYSQLPNTNQNEVILSVDWNENINVDENQNRIQTLFENEKTLKTVFSKVGEQQFLLERDNSKSFSEASIYLQTKTVNEIENLKKELKVKLLRSYPNATISGFGIFNVDKTSVISLAILEIRSDFSKYIGSF